MIFDKLLEMKGESSVNHVPMILVGNMKDLHPRRVISVEEVGIQRFNLLRTNLTKTSDFT